VSWRLPYINDACLPTTVHRFLLVSLNIEAILGGVTISQRRKILQEMARGSGLNDAYTATMTRLKAQKGSRKGLGLQALMWVLCSERPLRAEELCHALGVEIGSAELDPENTPSVRILLVSCLGLLTVEASSSTVRLVHFTLKEHLSNDSTLIHSSHSTIAEVCLTYLDFRSVRDPSPTLDSIPTTMPLLEYAFCYWGVHAIRGMTENVKILGRKFLKGTGVRLVDQLLGSVSFEGRVYFPYFYGRGRLTRFIEDEMGPYLGMIAACFAVMEIENEELNVSQAAGGMDLVPALLLGREEEVKQLLERQDVSNEVDTETGSDLLQIATMTGNQRIVKMLLERGEVNLNCQGEEGVELVVIAAMRGNEGMVKMLLEHEDLNLNYEIEDAHTPLSAAAMMGHGGVVKLLLEREDVNPDQQETMNGRTPLAWAAMRGYEGVVKILLERKDVNPDRPDTKCGRSPLSWAAEKGHEGVVKILLEREDVNPDLPDTKNGQTPISLAAASGNEGVLKILLERKDVNPDRPDTKCGLTPFSWAAQNGHEGVVEILLEQEMSALLDNTDSGQANHGGQAPPPLSDRLGDEVVGEIKSAPHDPNTNITDLNSQFQPPPATENARAELEDWSDVGPAMPDNENQNQLSSALSEGHDGMERILLERDHPDSDQENHGGQPPLPPSAKPEDELVEEIQSKPQDPNTNTGDFKGQLQSPPTTENEQTKLVDLQGSIPKFTDHGPSTPKPWWSRLLCFRPRNPFRRRRGIKTTLNNS